MGCGSSKTAATDEDSVRPGEMGRPLHETTAVGQQFGYNSANASRWIRDKNAQFERAQSGSKERFAEGRVPSTHAAMRVGSVDSEGKGQGGHRMLAKTRTVDNFGSMPLDSSKGRVPGFRRSGSEATVGVGSHSQVPGLKRGMTMR